jgi:archaetidylinositol phosphate synthase
MTLDTFRPHLTWIYRPFVGIAMRIGIKPDHFTIAAFFVALFAGIAFYYTDVVLGTFIITGIFAGGFAPWPIGVFALVGVFMVSYLGTQAQAVGVGRYYGGFLGRADRLFLLIIAGILTILIPEGVFGLPFLGWLLVIFGVIGNITAIQRFLYVWRELK